MSDSEDKKAFEDIIGRLADVNTGGTYINIGWDEDDDAWSIIDTNAEDQDELVAAISWVLYQFATGHFEYRADDDDE